MAAERLAIRGASVTVYERMPSMGRKLLLAGRGGLNITHSEPIESFRDRYRDARPFLDAPLDAFGPEDLRSWCAALGQDTFVGTSGRVFPVALRATPLLRAWLARLHDLGVELRVRHEWQGWGSGRSLHFVDRHGQPVVDHADAVVLALGGGSWPRVGSNGAWVDVVRRAEVTVHDLRPANCGFVVPWSEVFRTRFAGEPVKNVELAFGPERARGDLIITATGIEGGPVYALSASVRDDLDEGGDATITIDLLPDVPVEVLAQRLGRGRPKDSIASALRRAGCNPVAVGLLREAHGPTMPRDPGVLAASAKAVPVVPVAPEALSRSISTAGGIALEDVDESMMLRARPGTFVAGEMLDWEAPTGGYLLQAAFSTGVAAAEGAARWLARPR